MYNYSFSHNDKVYIKTPKVDSFDKIIKESKTEVDCATCHFKYPNGLEVTTIHTCDRIVISSNKKLIKVDDGVFEFED